MKKVIENLVDKNWKSKITSITRKEYWLKTPHCSKAISVRCVDNTVAHFCVHEVEDDGQRILDLDEK